MIFTYDFHVHEESVNDFLYYFIPWFQCAHHYSRITHRDYTKKNGFFKYEQNDAFILVCNFLFQMWQNQIFQFWSTRKNSVSNKITLTVNITKFNSVGKIFSYFIYYDSERNSPFNNILLHETWQITFFHNRGRYFKCLRNVIAEA